MSNLKKIARISASVFVVAVLMNLALARTSFAASTPVTVVNTAAQPVPVSVQPKLKYQGTFFNVGPGGSADLVVPAGIVLTDAHISFSVPAPIANAASLYIQDSSGAVLVYQLVNNTTFEAGIDLGSGIPSTGTGLEVQLSCYNISGNKCEGAIMWSGYNP
jgi:hypothetical protein